MIERHEIRDRRRDGRVRCSCGSEFANESDFDEHALNAHAEEAAKRFRESYKYK